MWSSITRPDVDPSSALSKFLVITFADLKKYKFYYWFAFPAFVAKPSWEISETGWVSAVDKYSPTAVSLPNRSVNRNYAFLTLKSLVKMEKLHESLALLGSTEKGVPAFFLAKGSADGLEVAPLAGFKSFFANTPETDVRVCFPLNNHFFFIER